jgi:DNA/RNA endonuclease YhcR with UshA esterase domain
MARISPAEARAWAGQTVTVRGVIRYTVNNGKQVLLSFNKPHQGHFKVLIPRESWPAFPEPPEQLYRVGQEITVSGLIGWYQGDPVIRVTQPEQIATLR